MYDNEEALLLTRRPFQKQFTSTRRLGLNTVYPMTKLNLKQLSFLMTLFNMQLKLVNLLTKV